MASLSKAPPSESSLMPQQEEEEEEEVEEDVDFNPLLKVTASSSEASSSLSSEIEGLNRDAVEIMEKFSDTRGVKSSNLNTEMQRNLTTEFENVEEEEEIASCGTDVNDFESGKRKIKNNPTKDLDNEDDAAICTRTRARYSLASCTLDELETFLQETDDEDDLQNIDDEQEYRKFLTAVLHGQENENVDEEEDEDNDADFEIELEEALALEGNLEEESPRDKKPETRQNKRQKQATAAQHTTKRRLLEQTRRSLRPLLPILPYGPATAAGAALSIYHGRIMNPENANASSGSLSLSKKEADLINGFTIQQIGQLYCLIHEHVQLLIQVFSLCIYDSSRQHIASQAQGLISQMLQMRNEVLKWKAVSYPSTCFFLPPPYACPSSIPDDEVSASSAMVDGTLCVPFVTTPVQSVLDVAPLNLVGRYMDDVCGAVQESRRRWCYMEPSPDDTHLERESLFSLPGDPGFNCELPNRTISSSTVVRSMPSSPTQQPPKKTLAATLVESTKKHSVALVPKEIAKLARGFIPLFNPTLFPRKPPPPAVVNRVLFTDTEDELLALGLMEYNTDWKAIQQRFLPCKSKHQIFVRRKNRCSSKASENPIKAVRRMKTSPLTVEEMACIQEGLKVYKSDWMAVWKFFVPHRDPSLLPRQWRIALGTQRSYRQDPEKKEKRRLYESERRKRKSENLPSWQYASERKEHDSQIPGGPNSVEDMCMDNASNANNAHKSMADWRPGVSSDIPGFNLLAAKLPDDGQTEKSTHGEAQPQTGNIYKSLSASKYSQHLLTGITPTRGNSSASGGPRSSPYFRPYRGRRGNNSPHWVKLAPDLPPVNLPPSVRIVSKQLYKGALHGAPSNVFGAKFNSCNVLKEANESSSLMNNTTKLHSERSRFNKDKHVEEEIGAHTELDMHPLLFQATEDGRPPYYPSNCYPSSSFTHCSGNQPQLNLSLLHNPHPEFYVDCYNRLSKAKECNSTSCAIDFHPLLQRTEDTNNESAMAFSDARLSGANEKANDLDLEMHLSSLSSKDKVSGDKDATVHHSMIPIDKSNTYNTNDVGEHSHPEIVMEQEELSDTDEEIEENVEFEHEEMADSEGDELEG